MDHIITEPSERLDVVAESLAHLGCAKTPYPHVVLDQFYDAATADALLHWLENDAPWVLDVRSFYVQYECHDLIATLSTGPTAAAVAPQTLDFLRGQVERIFGTELIAGRATVHAHKLVAGHAIGLHNDRPRLGVPSHRVIVHLNREFDDSYGGHLVLLDRQNPEQSTVIVRPLHNSAVLIEFSSHSWHCVEEVRAGIRYSLIYSFWRDDEYAVPAGFVDVLRPDEYAFLVEELRRRGADRVSHSGRTLLDHLAGTYDLLYAWGCDKDVCRAGLFHSALGTTSFPKAIFGDDTAAVHRLIGDKALAYVQRFSSLDAVTLEALVIGDASGPGQEERDALLRLFWANWLEQRDERPLTETECAQHHRLLDTSAHLLPAAVIDKLRCAIGERSN